ncbi:putative glycosyl transferase [Bernardetia litoralis DSM 6794]|uniref:Putative glycosyl transferase n=1 Tax=Bernardetia litoralis (strain ATCC 23117 / DSM 6794 / NBRC 15988 / NCIMB 1366 / Fx l1 / Sio-4) TaxID=880071 RepID=I4AIL0_BERLS|nr:glycosyltransferase [Bernardetia litoralis]AFM03795.1 putative glycosyl transferase [Bernardetia litoralis DSM 6794]
MKYVLFYTVNGLGLGHLTRCLSIARQLKKQDSSLVPLFFTSSEGSHLLYQEGFAYYKVPSKTIARETKLLKRNLAISYSEILTSIVNTYRPVALVVDTFPLGSMNDLLSVLGLPLKWKKFFIHREQMNMDRNKIETQNFYDYIIAPHSKGNAKVPVPRGKKEDLFWSNEILIREKSELQSREEVRKKLGVKEDENLLLINMGGGGDTTTTENYKQIFDLILSSTSLLRQKKIRLFVPEPPLNSVHELKEIFSKLPSSTISFSHFPLMELMPALDFAISATGYNTFHELLACGIPTIFIPKVRGYDDQYGRARRAFDAKAALFLEESQIQAHLIDNLKLLCDKKTEFSQQTFSFLKTDGAERAAHFLIEKINNKTKI